MSNKTRLQTNNTNLQSLIEKANALPDASSGGGGSIETCTVTVKSIYKADGYIYYTGINENGEVSANMTPYYDNTLTLTVVCNTAFGVYNDTVVPLYSGYGFKEDPSIQNFNKHIVLLTPPNNGDIAYLECIDDS